MKISTYALSVFCLGVLTARMEGGSFLEELSAPYHHAHISPIGTPMVHSFGIEPAFTGRDLFLTYSYARGNDVAEHETEVEMEWGITKRFGVIFEVPYVVEDEEGVGTEEGFGDLAIVPRVLVVAEDRFLLTAQIEVGLPTGTNAFGNEFTMAPGIAMWNDMGNGFTLNSTVAVEHNFYEDETEMEYGVGLIKTFGEAEHEHVCSDGHDHDHHHPHHVTGLFNLHLEITGGTPLNGDERGDIELEGLLGVSFAPVAGFDIRVGYAVPLTSPHDFDHRVTAGVIYHF